MSKKSKSSYLVGFVVMIGICFAVFLVYKKLFLKVKLKDKNHTYIFIERSDTFDDVLSDINSEGIIENPQSFEWLAKEMDLDKNIHPGKYRILNGMTMRQIINLIKYNKQEKIKLTFNTQIHSMDEFIEYVDDKLEISDSEIEDFLSDEGKLEQMFGLDPENCFALVVPAVHEISWAVSAVDFFTILKVKYDKVWNASRRSQAKRSGFSVPDIITIASIVQSESSIESEQEKIAGVYINRLNMNMHLQADPTLKFAKKSFNDRRVYNVDKAINSPYNTYKYKGLPPGPICLVNQQAIDATLNFAKHNFIFFCAKPSLNGYSDYSSSYSQHQKFASAYQRTMNKMGVSR
jgi:UPF0755 protein